MKEENEKKLIEALSSIAQSLYEIKNAMCEENGGRGIYIRGDINATTQEY